MQRAPGAKGRWAARALAAVCTASLVVIGLGGCGSTRRASTGRASTGRASGSAPSAAAGVSRRGGGSRLGGRRQPGSRSRLGARPPLAGGTPLASGAPASLRRAALAPAGTTQRVTSGAARLAVTLRSVIDPLRGSGARLPRGTRAVGVIVQIRSAGPGLYDSSATGDIRLVASAGAVTPVLATHGPCRTPLDDFDRYITTGEDRVGCVVFAVPNGATLDAVWFSPHAHRLGRLTWAP